LSDPDRCVGGFAASLDTWRGPSPFDVVPELLARASWSSVSRALVGPWLLQESEEYSASAFLGGLSGGLASALQTHGHDLYSAIFGYFSESSYGKRRPTQPYPRELIKSEHHLWACQQAITRLHQWCRQGFEVKSINAVARKMAQATSHVYFNPGRLTRFRDEIERELASNLSPAVLAFLWCTRGAGVPLSGRRLASSAWLESMRTSPHDLGLLMRLAPELVAFHLVLVENVVGTKEKAVA
jgi:hypothetical protein